MVKNLPANAGDIETQGFSPCVEKILWRRDWLPISVFLPGESHGQMSLVGYSPWGHKELDTTEQLTQQHVIYYLVKFNCFMVCMNQMRPRVTKAISGRPERY